MGEKEARTSGHKLKIGKIPVAHVARAIERDETAGLMKIVIDADCIVAGTLAGTALSRCLAFAASTASAAGVSFGKGPGLSVLSPSENHIPPVLDRAPFPYERSAESEKR